MFTITVQSDTENWTECNYKATLGFGQIPCPTCEGLARLDENGEPDENGANPCPRCETYGVV